MRTSPAPIETRTRSPKLTTSRTCYESRVRVETRQQQKDKMQTSLTIKLETTHESSEAKNVGKSKQYSTDADELGSSVPTKHLSLMSNGRPNESDKKMLNTGKEKESKREQT